MSGGVRVAACPARRRPATGTVWEDAWETFIPFFAFTPGVRKLLYTTNAIESPNYQLRKVTRNRGRFPSDDAAVKLLWLAIINIEDKRAREHAANKAQAGKRPGYHTAHRRTTLHRMEGSTHRTRHHLSRAHQITRKEQPS